LNKCNELVKRCEEKNEKQTLQLWRKATAVYAFQL